MRRLGGIVLLLLLGYSCSGSFLGDDPGDDPETVFEHFWEAYDRYYAHFELKEIDWEGVYREYRPKVGPETTPEELFEIFSAMIRVLEDGHVYLVGEQRRALSDGHLRNGRRNFDAALVEKYYLRGEAKRAAEGKIIYGITEEGIGYLRLTTLSGGDGRGEKVTGWITELDGVLEELSETPGLILDLRNNGGGRAYNTKYIAARFADHRAPFVMTRSRNGPGHGDFSEPRIWHASPGTGTRYRGEVAVLTNRFTFSAAEWLTLALRHYDHITHIGVNSGGGMAMFLPRELPNGWTYTISVQDTRSPEGQSYERIGITPDIFLEVSDADIARGRDTIIDGAIRHLLREEGR